MSDLLKKKLGGVKENEPLASHTTFKIGGPAKFFYLAKSSDDLLKAVKAAEELKIPYFILGWGSNLLVSDNGFDGLVIRFSSEKIEIINEEITAEGGVNLSRLVGEATKAGLAGAEFLAGIPGTVGGAAFGNAGAYGQGFGNIVTELEIYQNGEIKKISREAMKYSYRQSILKKEAGIILKVKIKLKKGDNKEIHSVVVKIIKERKEKLPFEPSAGCVFKNIDLKEIEINKEKVIKALDINQAEWEQVTKHGKLPISYIIDHLGLKEKIIGGCKVSEKHAAFFVNIGQAKAEHVMMLISDIKMEVRNKLGIQLQEEVQYLGF